MPLPTRHRRRTAGVLTTLLLAPALVSGQPLADRLASATSASCTFRVMATGNWKDGEPLAETRPATLSIAFEEISTEDGMAQAVGAFGVSDIIVRAANGYLHLVQSFRDGPLYVTTILPREIAGGRLQAVHTRHEYTLISMPGFTSRPEQYYGECEIKN